MITIIVIIIIIITLPSHSAVNQYCHYQSIIIIMINFPLNIIISTGKIIQHLHHRSHHPTSKGAKQGWERYEGLR